MGIPLLSLCMIVRDEETSIGKCLQSVQGIVDEIIVIDTGSTDRTAAICRSFGAYVWYENWNGSFADARNAGISKAKGQWILWLDADEVLEPSDTESLRESLLKTDAVMAALQVVNYTGNSQEHSEPIYLCPQVRLFRNGHDLLFKGIIHETLVQRQSDSSPLDKTPVMLPFRIHHYGYLEDTVRKKGKSERNLKLLELELASGQSDPWIYYHLASEYARLNRYEEAFEQVNKSIVEFLGQGQLPPALLYKQKYDILISSGGIEGIWPGIENAIRLYPDYVDLLFYKALYLLQKDLVLEAYHLLEKCLELGDASKKYLTLKGLGGTHARYYMAICLVKLGRHKEGSELMMRAGYSEDASARSAGLFPLPS